MKKYIFANTLLLTLLGVTASQAAIVVGHQKVSNATIGRGITVSQNGVGTVGISNQTPPAVNAGTTLFTLDEGTSASVQPGDTFTFSMMADDGGWVDSHAASVAALTAYESSVTTSDAFGGLGGNAVGVANSRIAVNDAIVTRFDTVNLASTNTLLLNGIDVGVVGGFLAYNFTFAYYDASEAAITLSFIDAVEASRSSLIDFATPIEVGAGDFFVLAGGDGSGVAGVRLNEYKFDIVPVPEPSACLMLGLGGLAFLLRRRK